MQKANTYSISIIALRLYLFIGIIHRTTHLKSKYVHTMYLLNTLASLGLFRVLSMSASLNGTP